MKIRKIFSGISLLSIVVLTLLTGCKKDNATKNQLEGRWSIETETHTFYTNNVLTETKNYNRSGKNLYWQFGPDNYLEYNGADDDFEISTYSYNQSNNTIDVNFSEPLKLEIREISATRLKLYTEHAYTSGGYNLKTGVLYTCAKR